LFKADDKKRQLPPRNSPRNHPSRNHPSPSTFRGRSAGPGSSPSSAAS
jgi:hypothetical protein